MSFGAEAPSSKSLVTALAEGQRVKNQPEVDRLAAQAIALLGDRAGIPESPDTFRPYKPASAGTASIEIAPAFEPYLTRLSQPKEHWWTASPAPNQVPAPLRYIAGVITGALAARRAGCDHSDQLLAVARGAGDYLLWAQAQGGRGVFPVPDLRGKGGRVPELTEKFLARADREGILDRVLVNGWLVDDLGGGDLQFDNGVCGVAVLELYAATRDDQYLRSARAAADWAVACPAVPNWNYNSFSVFLLAEIYRATGDPKYLDSAKEKTLLGILPGQLATGPRAGRWADPHNARLVYHLIICRGLGALLSVLPSADPELARVRQALERALSAATAPLLTQGVAHPETALETLSRLALWFPPGDSRLADAGRAATLDLLTRYVAESLARNHFAVTPNAWGLGLEALARARK